VSWKPGDLNIVIGPNGSGKSNLLRALEMISAGAQGKLSRYVRSEGGIGAILWDGAVDRIQYLIGCAQGSDNGYNIGYQLQLERLGGRSHYIIHREDLSTGDTAMHREGKEAIITQASKSEGTRFDGSILQDEEAFLAQAAAPIAGLSSIQRFQENIVDWAVFQGLRVDKEALIRQAVISRVENRVAADGQNLINVLHTLYTSDKPF
jgi:predicted ATPase